MFLHLSVSHSVHKGVSASVHAEIHPPGSRSPQEADTLPPGSRHPLQAITPLEADPPCAVHAGRYGQQAGGTHPTGMLRYTPQGADPPRKQTPFPQEADTPHKQSPPWKQTPPAQCMLGDTGNKRVVRILLECILVITLM